MEDTDVGERFPNFESIFVDKCGQIAVNCGASEQRKVATANVGSDVGQNGEVFTSVLTRCSRRVFSSFYVPFLLILD